MSTNSNKQDEKDKEMSKEIVFDKERVGYIIKKYENPRYGPLSQIYNAKALISILKNDIPKS